MPEWSISLGAQYETDLSAGNLRARVDYSYRSDMNVFSPTSLQPAYSLVNARLFFAPQDHLELAMYGKNIFDQQYATYRSLDLSGAPGSLGISNILLGPGREVGLEVIARYKALP